MGTGGGTQETPLPNPLLLSTCESIRLSCVCRAAEMKNYLHKLIVETDDESILYKVQAYFLTLKKKNIDWWDTISNQEKEIINLSLQQLENDEGIPHEEVKRKVDKLFGR